MKIIQAKKNVKELIKTLGSNNKKNVQAASQTLLRLKGNEIIPVLITAINNSTNMQVRSHAARLLGEISFSLKEAYIKQEVVNVLIQALQDKEDTVRVNTLMALGKQKDSRASQVILSLLVAETNPLLRFVEVQALGDIGSVHPAHLALLVLTMLVIMNDDSHWPATREAAENTLILFGAQCLPSLEKLKRHEDPLISSQANIIFIKISKDMTKKKRKTKCKSTVKNSKQM